MIPRGTIIAALLVIELAIIGEAVVAVRSGQALPTFPRRADVRTAGEPRVVEGGPHRFFDAGERPALTVDIGYADLTILTGKASQIEVSVSVSTEYGALRAKAPITARESGGDVRIATSERQTWSMGDDRMVTVIVPPRTRVTVVDAGDIRASGLRADASLNSVGKGSVMVEDYVAPALHLAASNGRISMHQVVATRVDATSRNGRVEGTALQVRDGSVEGGGRVTLGFAAGSDTLVSAQASNGKVILSGFPASASLAGRRSGEDGEADPSSQTLRVGAGNGRLDVHSSDGNINLSQEG